MVGRLIWRTFLVVQSAALTTALHQCGTYALDADPWGGLHAATFCPRVCSDCHGPYTYAHSTVATGRRGKKDWRSEIHCQREGSPPDDAGALALESVTRERSERRFGSGWSLFATLYPVWLVVASMVAFAVVRSRRARSMT
jgi:hypothetical protein